MNSQYINQIIQGNCLEIMKQFPDNSIDLIATDPPYGLKFMQSDWDKAVPSVDIWKECYRVLKPGAFAFIMSIPRQDCLARMIVNLEDAGFNVSFSSLYHAFASGFPKSMNIAKKITKDIDRWKKLCYNQRRDIIERNLQCQEKDLQDLKNVNIVVRLFLKRMAKIGKIILNGNIVLEDVLENLQEDRKVKKDNLNSVQVVEKQSIKSLIETGMNMQKKDFVVKNALALSPEDRLNANVKTAEKNLLDPCLMLEQKLYIVPENVKAKIKPSLLNVNTVELQSKDLSLKSKVNIVFVPINIQAFLCGKIKAIIKEEETQMTESGNQKFWQKMDLNARFVEVIKDLKLIILNQLKNIPNLDIIFPMELLTAINVIITKSIMECLILNMVDMLAIKLKEKADWLKGNYSGLQLKPAVEVILVVMKLFKESTYIDHALAYYEQHKEKGATDIGLGGINIDDCRIPYEGEDDKNGMYRTPSRGGVEGEFNACKVIQSNPSSQGRFPANILVEDNVLDDGEEKKGGRATGGGKKIVSIFNLRANVVSDFMDSGSFSRYFSLDKWWEEKLKQFPPGTRKTFPFMICPKANKGEKGENNKHLTCKPIKIMSWLITLGSRPKDIVLDPFAGSGTTCISAKMLSRKYIGIELDPEYKAIAEARLKAENMLF